MANLFAHFQKFHGKSRPVISTCLYGLVASLAAVAFQLAINWIYRRLYMVPSAALAGMLVRHNFYDKVLLQDGHQMEHVIPPRNLRSWHNLPISAIANLLRSF